MSKDSNSYFEKQRDVLLQEIGNAMDSVIYNMDILNRSLNNSIQVGKEFDDVGRLWSHFYDGLNQYKERQMEEQNKLQGADQIDESNDNDNQELESEEDDSPEKTEIEE